jgi:hypothetical protein
LKICGKNGIFFDYNEIVLLCEKYGTNELSIFGSSIRNDFTQNSDVDILVSFGNDEEINWLRSRYTENEKTYTEKGFSPGDFHTLTELLGKKLDYLTHHFETDKSYEWHGGFNFIVTGKK